MHEEYSSVLSTPTEANKIGCFGQYRYVGETQVLAWYINLSLIKSEYKHSTHTTMHEACEDNAQHHKCNNA